MPLNKILGFYVDRQKSSIQNVIRTMVKKTKQKTNDHKSATLKENM